MSCYLNSKYSALAPYTPGEQPQGREYIKLNTNESPFPPSPKAMAALSLDETAKLNLYPDPTCGSLTDALAGAYNVSTGQIFVGNGSDEILAFCFMAFCENGVAFADTTYGFYQVYAQLMGVQAQIIPLKEDFSLCADDYVALNKTIFIANPNAPTSLALPLSDIETILASNPDNLVIIDEAYVDFGAESAVALLDKYENLLVIQTFSKSRNLAGARLGFALGSKDIIADLNKIKFSYNPYNINRLTLLAGTAAVKDAAYFMDCCEQIKAARAYTGKALQALGFTVLPSSTNFIFAAPAHISGEAYYLALKEQGVLVRYFNTPRCKDYVRITIGTKEQMDVLLATTKLILLEADQ